MPKDTKRFFQTPKGEEILVQYQKAYPYQATSVTWPKALNLYELGTGTRVTTLVIWEATSKKEGREHAISMGLDSKAIPEDHAVLNVFTKGSCCINYLTQRAMLH